MKFEKIIKIILILATLIALGLIIANIVKEKKELDQAIKVVEEMQKSVEEGTKRLVDIILGQE